MMLSELIKDLRVDRIVGDPNLVIEGVTQDSRQVKKGYLFVAIPGTHLDGQKFVPDAVQKGARAVVVPKLESSMKVTQVVVENPRRALASIAARFYGDPSLRMRVIGITGTNGKTTLTFLLESIFREAGRQPAVLGTINYRYGGKSFEASTTTPESVDIQRLFAEMLVKGATDVLMEVSSHALVMERVREVHFDAAVFTNLSQDHLDFHRDLDDYFQAKLRLFTEYLPQSGKKEKFAILNMEDVHSEQILQSARATCVRTGLTGPFEISCQSFTLSADGIVASIRAGSELLQIHSSLMGRFNLENILQAVATAHGFGVPAEVIVRGIEKVVGVPGRLERISNERGLLLFVDYAHTPEALARVGENLRKLTPGRVLTVFGCGGDRDRTKRPLMGREAALFSDILIVTSDNPRTEDPEAIIDQILPGIEEVGFPKERLYRVTEREEALAKVLSLARRGDLILVAGKGHEDYQIIGEKKIPFSDQEVLRKFLKR